MKRIVGYSDKLSVAPGDRIDFMVSCEARDPRYRARIVRLICGDDNSEHPGYRDEAIDTPVTGEYPGRRQVIYAGSYIEVPPSPLFRPDEGITLHAMIWPTLPERGPQT
ncbi:MAG: hypothetical protein IRY94_11935, partial [Rhodospirillaceae bacterium]|nr:hypothetical protein [Rhodospirillaceae bacterium]